MSPIYSIVIPIKDEEGNITELLQEIEESMKPFENSYEVICIDDGSKDQSLSILKENVKEKKYLRILSFTQNFGQSSAFAAGFKEARGEFIITLDADLQNNPHDIPRLINLMGDADLVCGWRINRRDVWQKRMISKLSNAVRSRLCQDNMHDTGCSLKIYRTQALRHIKMYKGMHRFLPALFLIEGFRVKEVAVDHRQRQAGKTKYNFFTRLWGPIADMFVVYWMRKKALHHQIKERYESH